MWSELSLKKAPVRIGVATPRVLVRTVDLPTMSDDELAGALQFQAQELIPIPLEDAVLDFQILEALPIPDAVGEGPPPQPMSRVLLAAAHKDLIRNLTGAVRAAGLSVASVDLVPLALVRSVGRRVSDNGGGVEAVVSVGGGVTVVVVHELGIPRFVRILGSGGRSVTDAIARDLELTTEQAEAVKRNGESAPADLVARARTAMVRPINDLVEQIRGSLDYYRTQSDAIRLLRVTLTGGGSLTPGLADQLVDTVGVPVDLARPREHIGVGDIGFAEEQLPLLDPFLPVPVGLALGGLMTGKRIDLLGGDHKEPIDKNQLIKIGAVAGAVLVAALAGLTYLKSQQVDDEKSKLAAAAAEERGPATEDRQARRRQTASDRHRNAVDRHPDPPRERRVLVLDAPGHLAHDPDRRLVDFDARDRDLGRRRRTGSGSRGPRSDERVGCCHRYRELLGPGARLRLGGGLDPTDRSGHSLLCRPLGADGSAGVGHERHHERHHRRNERQYERHVQLDGEYHRQSQVH